MLDDLKEEGIVNKVGGRFKLSTLIQKRMVALNTGAKPLVDARGITDKMAIVIQEILQDKIYLDLSGNLQTRNETAQEAARNMLQNQLAGSYAPPAAIHTMPPAAAADDGDE
jgi:DNA-directed RNA polymerase subunit omega